MQLTQISDRVDQLARAWEQFKSINDSRLSQIEKKGTADPLKDSCMRRKRYGFKVLYDKVRQINQ